MNDEKRTTLSLKRKTTTTNAAPDTSHPVVIGKKKLITVATPPVWKQKKAQRAAKVKTATPTVPETEKPAKPAKPATSAKPGTVTQPAVPPVKKNRVPKGARVIPIADVVALMKPHWPGLFDGDQPRLLQTGIGEILQADIAQRALPLSRKQLRRCLRSITRSRPYLQSMVIGAQRYDKDGQPAGCVDEREQEYAAGRLDRQAKQP